MMAGEKTTYEQAKSVLQANVKRLLALANVVGVGVGLRQRGGELTDEIALVVMVQRKLPPDGLDPADHIPAEIEGVPVDVQEIGHVSAQE